jgi:hypothetical protein
MHFLADVHPHGDRSVSRKRKKRRPNSVEAPGRTVHQQLVAIVIAIMVMIVPVAIGVPAMAVFIPPFVVPAPASLAGLMQVVARVVRLLAVPAMMFNSFVEPVIGLGNATLAVIVIGDSARSSSEEQESAQCGRGQYRFPEPFDTSLLKSGHQFIPPVSARGVGMGGAFTPIKHCFTSKVSRM